MTTQPSATPRTEEARDKYYSGDMPQREVLELMAHLETELAAAKELLREIRDNEVNASDEADKFLRDHQPSALAAANARALAWSKTVDDRNVQIGGLKSELARLRAKETAPGC